MWPDMMQTDKRTYQLQSITYTRICENTNELKGGRAHRLKLAHVYLMFLPKFRLFESVCMKPGMFLRKDARSVHSLHFPFSGNHVFFHWKRLPVCHPVGCFLRILIKANRQHDDPHKCWANRPNNKEMVQTAPQTTFRCISLNTVSKFVFF